MAQNQTLTPLPSKWEKLLPIMLFGTEGKKFSFEFESLPLSTPKEVVFVLAAYLGLLALLKVCFEPIFTLSQLDSHKKLLFLASI